MGKHEDLTRLSYNSSYFIYYRSHHSHETSISCKLYLLHGGLAATLEKKKSQQTICHKDILSVHMYTIIVLDINVLLLRHISHFQHVVGSLMTQSTN